MSEYQIMGYAMAHEIGHLLLGPNSHSLSEIMRAKWHPKDLKVLAKASLLFTSQQAELIRDTVFAQLRWPEAHQTPLPESTKRLR